jgi:inosine-uridine nucleoside N-ribohydrolase
VRKALLFAAIFALVRFAHAETVWIDTDVSIGSPIREVDDAYALVLAFHSPELRIAGISTSYGNAPLDHTTRAARELVRRFGHTAKLTPAHIFAGAASASDFGRRTEASDGLTKTLEETEVTYIALGPLTNLATFLQLHPSLAPKIERVIFVGGQMEGTTLGLGPNRSFRIHDANVFKDPRATAVVLRSKIPMTLAPISTGSNLLLDETDLRQLEQDREVGNYLARRSRIWLWFWRHIAETGSGPIFDALAVVTATRPELVSTKRRFAKMDKAGNLIVTDRLTSGARRLKFSTSFAPATKPFVLRRLMSRSTKEGRFINRRSLRRH